MIIMIMARTKRMDGGGGGGIEQPGDDENVHAHNPRRHTLKARQSLSQVPGK
jgi:hypothetical protein